MASSARWPQQPDLQSIKYSLTCALKLLPAEWLCQSSLKCSIPVWMTNTIVTASSDNSGRSILFRCCATLLSHAMWKLEDASVTQRYDVIVTTLTPWSLKKPWRTNLFHVWLCFRTSQVENVICTSCWITVGYECLQQAPQRPCFYY